MLDVRRTKTFVGLGVIGAMLAACSGRMPSEDVVHASVGSENAAPAETVLLRYQPSVGAVLRTESRFTVLAGERVWMVMTGSRRTTITRVIDGIVESTHVELGDHGTRDRNVASASADAGAADAAASTEPTSIEYRDARRRTATPSWGSTDAAGRPGSAFPDHAVRIGDRWDDEAPVAPNDPEVRYHVFYRLVGLEGEGDARRAIVEGIATRSFEVDGVPRTSVYESRSVYDVDTGVELSFVFHIRTSDASGFLGGADLEVTTEIVARP